MQMDSNMYCMSLENRLRFNCRFLHKFCLKTSHLYLLLGPQLIKHFLDLQFPVILQRVEGLCWHLKKARLLDGRQMVQNSCELRPGVRV